MKSEKPPLTELERYVIEEKGTERPFSGAYSDLYVQGLYHCRRCDAPLFSSDAKFVSECGWLSFEAEIPGAVRRQPDGDGQRTEIVCARCDGHLGHVFAGEGYTAKNIRHCVNSVSLSFESADSVRQERALLASGCFWGTQYHLEKLAGVIRTRVGFAGGWVDNPAYEQVCGGATGHLEVVEVIYDVSQVTYTDVLKRFFETHDFSQVDGQGPDIGSQYLSAVFALTSEQKVQAEQIISLLKQSGRTVVTTVRDGAEFYPAEVAHQRYYAKRGTTPYCHVYRKIF